MNYFDKEKIKRFISKGETENALAVLTDLVEGTALENTLTLLNSRYSRYKSDLIKGVSDNYNELIKIDLAILELIDNPDRFVFQEQMEWLKQSNIAATLDQLLQTVTNISVSNTKALIPVLQANETDVQSGFVNYFGEEYSLDQIKKSVHELNLVEEHRGFFIQCRGTIFHAMARIQLGNLKNELGKLSKILDYLINCFYTEEVNTLSPWSTYHNNQHTQNPTNTFSSITPDAQPNLHASLHSYQPTQILNLTQIRSELGHALTQSILTQPIHNMVAFKAGINAYLNNLKAVISEVGRITSAIKSID